MLPTIATGNVGSALAGEYEVANSLRFNSGSSDYLERTPSSEGNKKKWTWSAWIKRSKLGSEEFVFYSRASADNDTRFYFESDKFKFQNTVSNTTNVRLFTNRVFRDVSAWYNIIISYDSTVSSPDTNSIQMFVNGVKETSFSATIYPSQNQDTFVNDDALHTIGRRSDGASNYFNGYMAEVVLIDGQALDPTSFGEFDSDTNIWKPIDVSGLTFGTNGFYLDFENSSSLGADVSGNGNNFTVNNLTSIDQTTDTCTNNFATLNLLAKHPSCGASLSEGNLKATYTTSRGSIPATIGFNSGKWYFEWNVNTAPQDGRWDLGIQPFANVEANDATNSNNRMIGLNGYNGYIYYNGSSINNFYNTVGGFTSFTGIIGVAVDLDSSTKTMAMSRNGDWITGTGTTDSDFSNALKVDITSSVDDYDYWHFGIGTNNGSGTGGVGSANFGNPPYSITSGNSDANGYGNFEYAVPSGYYALNTKNLAEYG